MNELLRLLLFHFERYPLMECADGVKLLYQNEFGCGHLVAGEGQSYALLLEEYRAMPEGQPGAPLVEPIGGGLCRVYLNGLPEMLLAPLHGAFVQTAGEARGNLSGFLEKLSALSGLAGQGKAPFSREALKKYLAAYRKKGYPAVSHSARYREAYRPHYRVVRQALVSFLEEKA